MIVNELAPIPQAANENLAGTAGERMRTFAVANERKCATHDAGERMAMAMLRSGLSFMDAAESSGVSVERVMTMWTEQRDPRGCLLRSPG